MNLQGVVEDVADALVAIDRSGIPFKNFKPGVGPYGEPQLVREVTKILNQGKYWGIIETKRTPDLLIQKQWAIEIKLVRPFGDNDKRPRIGR